MAGRRSPKKLAKFRQEMWRNFKTQGRDFPWRRTRDPYRILVSEIMLQQTQTSRVVPKYQMFVRKFPNFKTLARARTKDVLAAWQGLGYNRRALALKKLSHVVVTRYKGRLPRDATKLVELPGIGKATAGAVMAFAFNKHSTFIETNIRRVYIHFFFRRQKSVRDEDIMELVKRTADTQRPREWYWALMDYGVVLAKTSAKNPNRKSIRWRRQPAFQGSKRQLRGRALAALLAKRHMHLPALARLLGTSSKRTKEVISDLEREGFVNVSRGRVSVR